METSVTHCLVCSKPFVGRSDKKFCSDHCRAQLHNKKKKLDEAEVIIQEVNRILRRNRSILKGVSPLGRATLRQEYLALQGFNFTYFTHQVCTPKGNLYRYCYDYGYLLLPEGKVRVISRQTAYKQALAGSN